MSTVAPLAAFCAAMAALAVGRSVYGSESDPLEIGSALLLLGITGLVVAWLAVRYGWSRPIVASTLAGGVVLSGAGIILIARQW